jgi:DNA-directed RNA polymerase subunit omega
MARITVEDCLNKVNNRFALIHMAAKRVRQLRKGAEATIVSKNKDIVVALREIAAGNVAESEMVKENQLLAGNIEMPSQEDVQEETDQEKKSEEEGTSKGS